MKKSTIEMLSINITPACMTLGAFLLNVCLSRFCGNWRVLPDFALANMVYWSLFLPGSLPYWFLFVLGWIQDSINGTPPGMSSMANITLVWLVSSKLRFIQDTGFMVVWGAFAVLALALYLMEWCIISLYYIQFMPLDIDPWQLVLSLFAYPLIHRFLASVCHKIAQDG